MSHHILVLDGNIASGKSTVLRHLRSILEHNFRIFEEPVALWRRPVAGQHNLLAEFYEASDVERKAQALVRLQIYITSTLIDRRKEAEDWLLKNKASFVLLERSTIACQDFCRLNKDLLDPRDKEVLEKLASSAYHSFPSPGLRLCLIADPEICFQRLQRRGRSEENRVTFEYIKELDKVTREAARKRGDTIIDTSKKTEEEVLHEVIRQLQHNGFL